MHGLMAIRHLAQLAFSCILNSWTGMITIVALATRCFETKTHFPTFVNPPNLKSLILKGVGVIKIPARALP